MNVWIFTGIVQSSSVWVSGSLKRVYTAWETIFRNLDVWFFVVVVFFCFFVFCFVLLFVWVPRRVLGSVDKEKAFVPGILVFCSINNPIILFIAIIKEGKTFVMNTININGYKSLNWLPCTVKPVVCRPAKLQNFQSCDPVSLRLFRTEFKLHRRSFL